MSRRVQETTMKREAHMVKERDPFVVRPSAERVYTTGRTKSSNRNDPLTIDKVVFSPGFILGGLVAALAVAIAFLL